MKLLNDLAYLLAATQLTALSAQRVDYTGDIQFSQGMYLVTDGIPPETGSSSSESFMTTELNYPAYMYYSDTSTQKICGATVYPNTYFGLGGNSLVAEFFQLEQPEQQAVFSDPTYKIIDNSTYVTYRTIQLPDLFECTWPSQALFVENPNGDISYNISAECPHDNSDGRQSYAKIVGKFSPANASDATFGHCPASPNSQMAVFTYAVLAAIAVVGVATGTICYVRKKHERRVRLEGGETALHNKAQGPGADGDDYEHKTKTCCC